MPYVLALHSRHDRIRFQIIVACTNAEGLLLRSLCVVFCDVHLRLIGLRGDLLFYSLRHFVFDLDNGVFFFYWLYRFFIEVVLPLLELSHFD